MAPTNLSRTNRSADGSGLASGDLPDAVGHGEANTVVQAVRASLPELDEDRLDAIATPRRGHRDGRAVVESAELLGDRGRPGLEIGSALDGVRLCGGIPRQLRSAGPVTPVQPRSDSVWQPEHG